MGQPYSRRTGPLQDGRKENVRMMDYIGEWDLLTRLLRWGSMTPLRQFRGVPADVIRKAEGKQFVRPLYQTYLREDNFNFTSSPGTDTSTW